MEIDWPLHKNTKQKNLYNRFDMAPRRNKEKKAGLIQHDTGIQIKITTVLVEKLSVSEGGSQRQGQVEVVYQSLMCRRA